MKKFFNRPNARRSKHYGWRGGMYVTKKGYWRISAGPLRGRYAHREYLARQVGRPLRDDEEVEHLCKNRACWPPTDFHLCLMDQALADACAGDNTKALKWKRKGKMNDKSTSVA